MLSIRPEQIAVLARDLRRRFELEMCHYLRHRYYDRFDALSDQDLHLNVASAIRHAEQRYGMESRRDCASYLDLVAQFDWDFDQQARYRWIVDCLDNEYLGTISTRLRAVFHAIAHEAESREERLNHASLHWSE